MHMKRMCADVCNVIDVHTDRETNMHVKNDKKRQCVRSMRMNFYIYMSTNILRIYIYTYHIDTSFFSVWGG